MAHKTLVLHHHGAAAPVRPAEGAAALLARLRETWKAFRRDVFPTDAEIEEAYLNDATDLRDLEARMRILDRRRYGQARSWQR